jgi:hypothetical protein
VFLLLEVENNRLSISLVFRVSFQMTGLVKSYKTTSVGELVVLLLRLHSAGGD